ncbi:hypothetical protein HOY80DRAFT_1137562 [Tuber brumale]|nr:hypothetical protein HOY80DRAFT_1137562 [Tuber brumale]
MVGLVIAALTLLVAMVPLFRCQRFHHWVSSLSIPPFVKKPLRIIALPNPPPAATTAEHNLGATPVDEIPIPGPTVTISSLEKRAEYCGSMNHWGREDRNRWSHDRFHKDRHIVRL